MLKSVERYIRKHQLVRPGDRVGVAVSGGADSVALLRALHELAPSLGIVPVVLHLNHTLRGVDSDADACFVRELASQLSLDCAIEIEDVASLAALLHLSLEAAGRRARYAFFLRAAATYRLDCVATAHTRDDQAETVLLRLMRGAGTSGLAGIHLSFDLAELASHSPEPELDSDSEFYAVTPRLIRPLLSSSRQQVEEYLRSVGQPFRQDTSNFSSQFLRNRVRGDLLPALERDYNPRLRQALCETAEIAAGENTFLDELVSSVLGQFDPERGIDLKPFQTQPLALQRRILRRLCEPFGLALDFQQLEAAREFALLGKAGRFSLPRGYFAEVVRDKLLPTRLCIASTELTGQVFGNYCIELSIPGSASLAGIWGKSDMCIRASRIDSSSAIQTHNRTSLLSPERIGSRLTIRNLLPGDRFHPLHCGGERKINRLLQDLRIPPALRRRWPVALAGNEIVWVPGLSVAENVAWASGESEAVIVEMQSGEDVISHG